jgi:small subunit ribosomal protein S3
MLDRNEQPEVVEPAADDRVRAVLPVSPMAIKPRTRTVKSPKAKLLKPAKRVRKAGA